MPVKGTLPPSPLKGDFVHLHVHSQFSLLDGLSSLDNLVQRAKELGQPALALTDHGNMHGMIDFFLTATKAGIKPIVGVEAYMTRWGRPMTGRNPQKDSVRHHSLLLAQNYTGYLNLLKLISEANLRGFYYKPRFDADLLAQYNEGLITTTGCLGGEIPYYLNDEKQPANDQMAEERLRWYIDVFGRERFFVELQPHDIPALRRVNKKLVALAKKYDLEMIVSNDVHYARAEDADAQDILLCVQTGAILDDEKRMRMSGGGSYYLKSRAELEAAFRPYLDVPASAFDNTVKIAEMCQVDLSTSGYNLPIYPLPDGFDNDELYLRHLTDIGLKKRYGDEANSPKVQQRKEHELKIIHDMGFDTYYLIVWDLCEYAKSKGIWWNVRGSGAGSLVAYAMGITNLDPLPNNLIFERFLNPGRVSMPDFDLDYPDDQRDQMIEYTIQKYGDDQVAQIVVFGTMKAKASVRDVARAMNIPLDKVDRIAKLIPTGPKIKLKDAIEEVNELKALYKQDPEVRELLDNAKKLEGVARHISIHPAAVIIADKPLVNYTPLLRAPSKAVRDYITQYTYPILESLGLLKMDFLGLSTLTIMRVASELIKERHGVELTLNNIPIDDPRSYELLASGDVTGVFQVESEGMRGMLRNMKPSKFEHIVAAISLYRPGPMQYIPTYIKRLHGHEKVQYKHESLEPILAETYGIIVYQEQIIQIASQLAGYTPGEADLMRRAVSKKKDKEMALHRVKFLEGAVAHGIPHQNAVEIYDDIVYFANYGFNKCLPGDVEVLDADTGRLIRIEALYANQTTLTHTLSCNTAELTLQHRPVARVMANGLKPVFRLQTATGRAIEATANHPFYTHKGWRWLKDLTPGQRIATPRHIPVQGKQHWEAHQIISLGHLLAANAQNQEAMIPAEIFELPNRQIALLISHMWKETGSSLRYATASEKMARQLQHLLLRLGIISHLRTMTTSEKDKRQQWHISITGDENINTFTAEMSLHPTNPGEPVNTIQEDIYWDEIVSIAYVGEKQTYDLEVPETHNFVANDILVHNSHAADYGVITVQTAYLKAYYPVEYMAALLTVGLDNLEKVTLFINECRHMGIEVLPPDINHSGMGFTIKENPNTDEVKTFGRVRFDFRVQPGSAIRFGLAAIKNVGEGPVHEILRAREEGPFASPEDFCKRTDLRKVNRRTLEALIKVGAMDAWGPREQLLATLEQMQALSKSIWEAKDIGQGSLFDLLGDDDTINTHQDLTLATSYQSISQKEKLAWEKELLGVYVSSHPLLEVTVNYQHAINATCTDVTIDKKSRSVAILGMVASARTINTKKGDRMAFVSLEDMQGVCDVTVFPKLYEKSSHLLYEGSIVLVRGKVDVRNDKAGIIAESITNKLPVRADSLQEPSAIKETSPSYNAPPAPVAEPEPESPAMDTAEIGWMPTYDTAASPEPPAPVSPRPAPRRTLNIRFTLTEEPHLDIARLDQVMQLLEQFPGEDTITLTLLDSRQACRLRFPQRKTGYSSELVAGLQRILGKDALEVIRERPTS
jgi:DNA polymerase-3 subunit alpha